MSIYNQYTTIWPYLPLWYAAQPLFHTLQCPPASHLRTLTAIMDCHLFSNKPRVSIALQQSKIPNLAEITLRKKKNEATQQQSRLFSQISQAAVLLAAFSCRFHPPPTISLTKNDSHIMLSYSCCGFVPVELLCQQAGDLSVCTAQGFQRKRCLLLCERAPPTHSGPL